MKNLLYSKDIKHIKYFAIIVFCIPYIIAFILLKKFKKSKRILKPVPTYQIEEALMNKLKNSNICNIEAAYTKDKSELEISEYLIYVDFISGEQTLLVCDSNKISLNILILY